MKPKCATALSALCVVMLTLAGCDLFTSTEQRIARTERQMADGDYSTAQIELKNVVQKEPRHARAQLLLAEVSLKLGDLQAAEQARKAAVGSGISAADAAELQARILLAAHRHKDLEEQLTSGAIKLAEPLHYLYLGEAFKGLRRFDEAAAAFSMAVAKDETLTAAQLGLAEIYIAQGRLASAVQEIEAVLQTHPDSARAWLIRGQLLASRGLAKAAEESYSHAREKAAGQLDASQRSGLLLSLGELHLGRADLAGAQALQAELAKSAAGAPLGQLLAGRIAIAKQDYPAAISELQPLVAAYPEFVQAQIQLGIALLANNKVQQAELQLEQAVHKAPNNPEAKALLGSTRLLIKRPDDPAVLAMIDARVGRTQAALERIAALQKEDPKEGAPWLLEGEVRVLFKQYPEAVKAFEAAQTLEPQTGAVLKAYAARKAGKLPGAENSLERWLKENPNDHRVRVVLAGAYSEAGRKTEAISHFERLVAANPKSPILLNNLAWLYYEVHDPRAQQTARSAYNLAPKMPGIGDTYGWILVEAGRTAEGLPILQAAVTGAPTQPTIRYHHAVALARAGERDRAREQLVKLLKDGGSFANRSDAERLLTQLGG